jgi:hypothetical protein
MCAECLRKQQLLDWLEMELPAFFANRLLPVEMKVAERWGKLLARPGAPSPPSTACSPPQP